MKSPGLNHETVRELIRTATPDRILRVIGKSHPADIALLFRGLEPAEVRLLFDVLFSARRVAKTLKELPPDLLPDILALIEDEKVARVIAWADPDDAVTFTDSLAEERREKVLSLVDPDSRERVRQLISYPEGTVGRIMTTDYLALSPGITAQGAIDKIRERGELEAFFYLYVVEESGRLVGVVPIRNLVLAPQDRTLGEMMIAEPIRAEVTMDQEEAARLVSKYELLALPIVDHDGRLAGIITVDDVIDIIDKETTEDMYRMAGLEEEDRVFSPSMLSIRKRLPWTALNLLTAMLAASVVGFFESTIEKAVALAIFMPVVAGMGGNCGIQTLTVVVRGMALGELEFSSAWRAVLKEVTVGITVGCAAGVLVAIVAYLWKGNPVLGLVLASAMIINLFVAALAGTLIPLALKQARLDPALGSGIFVTTFTDVFGFLSFLGLATVFLRYLA
ncbi:MAG: magnesium transporter [Deltaproteobacteria bacterium]|nr:magnesium transporter [Deltaproteobacteria bacterium]MBI2349691.1 magnesium transporter [Deltaproteobacteria bacterium]